MDHTDRVEHVRTRGGACGKIEKKKRWWRPQKNGAKLVKCERKTKDTERQKTSRGEEEERGAIDTKGTGEVKRTERYGAEMHSPL